MVWGAMLQDDALRHALVAGSALVASRPRVSAGRRRHLRAGDKEDRWGRSYWSRWYNSADWDGCWDGPRQLGDDERVSRESTESEGDAISGHGQPSKSAYQFEQWIEQALIHTKMAPAWDHSSREQHEAE